MSRVGCVLRAVGASARQLENSARSGCFGRRHAAARQRRLRRRQRRPRAGDRSRMCKTLCDAAANAAGFGITEVALDRRARSRPRRNPGARRHHRAHSSLLFLDAARARARADEQSVDRRRDRAQALSRPAAHRDQGAQAVRALAEGRPRRADRRRRHRAGDFGAAALCRRCRWWSATAPNAARSDFLDSGRALSGDRARRSRPRCWSPSGAGICI